MIWSLLFIPIFLLINLIISFLPSSPSLAYDLSVLISFIRKGMYFTNSSIFYTCVSTFVFWEGISFSWGIIKWVYTKIPFISIR